MTTDKKLKTGQPVIEEYRGWSLGRGNYGYDAEHPRKGNHYAGNLKSLKRIIREIEIGDVKLVKGTPSPEHGAVFHYTTTYRGESFTVRRRKIGAKVRWEIFPDGGKHKGRLVAREERLADVRYWLYSHQDSQMCEDDRNAVTTLVKRIKSLVSATHIQVREPVEKAVDELAAMVQRVD